MIDGFQKVIVSGVLSNDPKSMSDGRVAKASIPTTDRWKDKEGNAHNRTEWHTLTFFNRDAEVALKYLEKGSIITLEGKNRTSKWKDKDNNDRYSLEIEVISFQMLGSVYGNKGKSQSSRSNIPSNNNQSGNNPARPNPPVNNNMPNGQSDKQPARGNNNQPPASEHTSQGQSPSVPDEDLIGNYMDHDLEF